MSFLYSTHFIELGHRVVVVVVEVVVVPLQLGHCGSHGGY
jgi:hypothetical protein